MIKKHRNGRPGLLSDPTGFWTAVLAARYSRDPARPQKRTRRSLFTDKGFSLVEVIIVIAIMAILAASITPVVIRYIDKSRKAVDLESAEMLFKAAELAATSSNDDAMEGWTTVALSTNHKLDGYAEVTDTGHNALLDTTASRTYHINVIAWARGVNYNANGPEWQNAKFKVTRDSDYEKQIQYTDEFLTCLVMDSAKGETYKANKELHFHGHSAQTVDFRYKKSMQYGKAECWLICVNCETHTPEVWVGDKNYNNNPDHKVRPVYRLYPDPCADYKE